MMLAEEILRAELKKLYGDNIKIFQCDIVATSIAKSNMVGTRSLMEVGYAATAKERYVNIVAIVGPFERVYPNNPPEDKRRTTRRVKAEIRLFSIESAVNYWRPHVLTMAIFNESVQENRKIFTYEDGFWGCGKFSRQEEDAKNPCEDMVVSQIQPEYPQVSRSNIGLD
jgi:hypothetical protein